LATPHRKLEVPIGEIGFPVLVLIMQKNNEKQAYLFTDKLPMDNKWKKDRIRPPIKVTPSNRR